MLQNCQLLSQASSPPTIAGSTISTGAQHCPLSHYIKSKINPLIQGVCLIKNSCSSCWGRGRAASPVLGTETPLLFGPKRCGGAASLASTHPLWPKSPRSLEFTQQLSSEKHFQDGQVSGQPRRMGPLAETRLWLRRGLAEGGLARQCLQKCCPGERGHPAAVGGLEQGCDEGEHSRLLPHQKAKKPLRDLPLWCLGFQV